jgi:hypothetical protein
MASWLSLAEVLRRRSIEEAEQLSDRERVLETMAEAPRRRPTDYEEPDDDEFNDHGKNDQRRPKGWKPSKDVA